MDATTLATEATRYLEAIDLFHAMELDVTWRLEVDEVGALSSVPELQRLLSCAHCAGPRVRINGRHICLAPSPVAKSTADSGGRHGDEL